MDGAVSLFTFDVVQWQGSKLQHIGKVQALIRINAE